MTVLYFAICLIATAVGAVSGIGGGVIIKPVFDLFSGMGAAQISFLSGCTVLSMAAVSLLRSKGGSVKVAPRRGTLLGIGAALGGIAGKLAFDYIHELSADEHFISVVQNSIMVALTLGVFAYILFKGKISTKSVSNPAVCIGIGLFLGLAGAFLGIGGGPINLVVLYYFFSMDTKTAAINSLYIIFFSQISSLLMLILSGTVPVFQWQTLAVMAAGGIMGGFFGRSLAGKLTQAQTDRLFLVVLLLITLISGYNVFKPI